MRNVYEVLVRKLLEKTILGRLKCKCEKNIKMEGRGGENGTDWIHIIQFNDGLL
jgi:hypothetical protein